MLLSQKRLRVVANPFAVPLDHRGRPVGAVMYDPAHSAGFLRYIGATMDQVVVEKRPFTYSPDPTRKMEIGGQLDRVDRSYTFDLAPIEIIDTRYHRQRIQRGALLPADAATAKLVGVPFVDPETALEEGRARRIDEYRAQHEEDPPTHAWKLTDSRKAGEA